jgi:GDPmannose 4,6-dehydratase
MKKALICGVSGQDGAYLARSLLEKGYAVYGTSRDAQMAPLQNLQRLGIRERVDVLSAALVDFRSVLQTLIKVEPDEVYNLAGQTSVALSFEQPVETLESISVGTLNLLEAIRFSRLPCRLYNATSGDCFGDTGAEPADERTPFRPTSPYAVAKAAAHWQVATYRSAYGVFACSGILFNHESPLRPERFVTRKIVAAACRIANGSRERLELGNTAVERDWGWAPEYVEAMWLMLQQERAEDYVIATGHRHSLRELVETAFGAVGCDPRAHVAEEPRLLRPSDIASNCGNPAKAAEQLHWRARYRMQDVVRMMVEAELDYQRGTRPEQPGASA